MHFILQYSENDSETESVKDDGKQKKRLPLPDFLGKSKSEKYELKEENDEGKIRNFPHEPGNWATYVYLPLASCSEFSKFLKNLIYFFKPLNLKPVEDFHISLTRTVILRHHWIQDFTRSIKNSLRVISCFKIHLCGLKTYVNEQRTRSFLSLKVVEGREELQSVVKQLDACLRDYNLQSFYQDPSFHVSLLWCSGDKCSDINKLIDVLPLKLKNFELDENVSHCVCASGNKRFVFNFQE